MPTVTLNKKVFEKLAGKKLSPENLKDRISMLGTDLEKIEGDEIIVEVFPQRPDMLSEQGFARAFASFIGTKPGLREYKAKKSGSKVIIDKSVSTIRPYTACAIVKGLKFDDEKIREIIQIQEKLHITYGRNRKKAAIGIYPLEAIKLPIKYFAQDPKKIKFQPLEFPREITGLQVLSQHPAGRAYAELLEGLDKFAFFADDNGEILSMPPIINSHKTGKISESTTDVFVECSGFDFDVLSLCLNIIVTTLADMGGDIFSMELEYPDKRRVTPDLSPKNMKLDLGYCNKLLGLSLKEKEAEELLGQMGYGYEKKTGNVLVPCYRQDVLHPIDLVEDIAIAYGYENFEPEIPNVATIGEESMMQKLKRTVCNIMSGMGFIECSSYHLINKDMHNKMMNSALDAKVVEIANAVNEEYSMLRSWIIPSLMKVLKDNKHHEYPQNIFESGTIFKHSDNTETRVEEVQRTGAIICSKDADYTKILQAFDYLMRSLDVKYEIIETEHLSFIPGRCGRVIAHGKKIAYIGEINPIVLENFDIEMPVAAFELNLSELF